MTFEEAVRASGKRGSQWSSEILGRNFAKTKQEGWGGKGGVGKGSVTTVRPKKNGGMTMGGK